jgi:cold-inducible RNA-binding protein
MPNDSRLFVGNLSYQTLEKDLQDYFSQAGVVTNTNIMLDKFTGKSRGFAFVEYSTSEEAQKAVEMFHNKEFQGRTLTVNIARPREERPQSGGGGYRGGSRGGGYRGDRGDRYDRGDRDRRSE